LQQSFTFSHSSLSLSLAEVTHMYPLLLSRTYILSQNVLRNNNELTHFHHFLWRSVMFSCISWNCFKHCTNQLRIPLIQISTAICVLEYCFSCLRKILQ
jgi:hypothetical protein